MISPSKIALADAGLLLHWPDGAATMLSAAVLRIACRCAECQSAKLQGITIDAVANIRVLDIKPIGHYAAQLMFSDGHQRGIYPWPYLATLAD